MFGPEFIRINKRINGLIKTVWSAVYKNRAERGSCFGGVSREFFKARH